MSFNKNGSCLCGEITFKITAEPLFVHACHCTNCQKLTGTSYWLSMLVLAKDFQITSGEPDIVCPPQQHGVATKHFCGKCGCNIYGTHTYLNNLVLPATGTFEKTDWFKPQAHTYIRSKQPWVKISDAVPSFEASYDREEAWPKESLDRLNAI